MQKIPMEILLQLYFPKNKLHTQILLKIEYLQKEKGLPPQLKKFFKIRPLTGRESLFPDKSCNMKVEGPIFSLI